MKTAITFTVDTANLQSYTDQHLVQLWHISQANPAAFGDRDACEFTEHVAREIIRRFLALTAPDLWTHQGRHVAAARSGRPDDATCVGPIDQLLRERVLPNEGLTVPQLFTRLELPHSVTNENALYRALVKAGFRQSREASGDRRRIWISPFSPDPQGLPREHPECTGTPNAPSHASPQPALPAAVQGPQETLRPTALPAQTEFHQSSSSSPPPTVEQAGSLALQEGGAT